MVNSICNILYDKWHATPYDIQHVVYQTHKSCILYTVCDILHTMYRIRSTIIFVAITIRGPGQDPLLCALALPQGFCPTRKHPVQFFCEE